MVESGDTSTASVPSAAGSIGGLVGWRAAQGAGAALLLPGKR